MKCKHLGFFSLGFIDLLCSFQIRLSHFNVGSVRQRKGSQPATTEANRSEVRKIVRIHLKAAECLEFSLKVVMTQ